MSKRCRTVQWCEGRIRNLLSKKQEITTYLAMSALTFDFEVRDLDEQHNLDIALENLLFRKIIIRDKNCDGHTSYSLAA